MRQKNSKLLPLLSLMLSKFWSREDQRIHRRHSDLRRCAETHLSDTVRLLVPAGNSKSFSCKLRAPNSEFYRVLTETVFKQGCNYCRHTRDSALRSKHVVPFNKSNICLQMIWAAVTATLCSENNTVNWVLGDAVCVIMRALGFGGSADKVSACVRYDRRFQTVCWSHLQGPITFNVITFRAGHNKTTAFTVSIVTKLNNMQCRRVLISYTAFRTVGNKYADCGHKNICALQ